MAWPVDGRGRGLVPRGVGAMSEQEFHDRFVETVVHTAIPLLEGLGFPEGLDETQARLFHATYLQHFSFFAWKFPSWLMSIASQCPHQDIRRGIIEDCVDEEVSDVDAGGRCHIDVLYDEAEACGMMRDVIAATEPTPIVLACIHAFENLSRTLGWEASYAAISALEIMQSEPAVKLRNKMMADKVAAGGVIVKRRGRDAESLGELTGLPAEQMVFAALHAYKDQFHGGGELAMLVKYGATREVQDKMLWAAKAGAQVYAVMRQEIDRVARAAVGLAPLNLAAVGQGS